MATDDSTSTKVSKAPSALRVAERYPLVAPVVEHEFKRICPTLDLIDFNSFSTEIHWIVFSGTEAELLRLRVIDLSMIAVRPKRVFRADGRDCLKTTRLAGDRIEVRMDLNESLDRAHPLGPLASWNWEALVEKAENPGKASTRPPSLLNTRCPPELQAARQRALVSLGKLAEFADSFPKQVAAEIMRRLLSLEELLRRETERRAPQVKPARPSYLRLVSSTMRGVKHDHRSG